jgi:hypothetical protein
MFLRSTRRYNRTARAATARGVTLRNSKGDQEIMIRLAVFIGVFAFAGALLSTAAGNDNARVPVLLELFTSEGCSSCPPADRLLQVFDQSQPVSNANLIVLSEHVDYWDRLGWKDPFSSPQFTARQQDYAGRYSHEGVYTPQLVVDGRFALVGNDSREANAAIQKAAREPKVGIALSDVARDGKQVKARVEVSPSGDLKRRSAVLYLAIADNRAESPVARGENAGRSLAHVAVTRVLKDAGTIDLRSASSKDVALTVPVGAGANSLRLVVFLEDPASGHILGAAAQKL